MAPGDGDDTAVPSVRESFGEAMRKTGLGQVAPGEVPSMHSLLAAIGGVRGLIESIVPGLGFLIIYTLTKSLLASVLIPLALAVVFIVIRFLTRSAPTQAITGVVVLAVSAILALVSGKPENNFLFGIWINAASLAVILVSIVIRWPLIGVIVGFLTNETTAWRTDRAKRRVLLLATWLWAGLFLVRLAIEVPLYFAHQTAWLAGARLVTGIPLYAMLLWVTWLLVRAVYSRQAPAADGTGYSKVS